MIITLPENYKNGQEMVAIPKEEYEALMTLKSVYEFQPTSIQKQALERARKTRKKGDVLTLGELKQKLGLTN